MAVKNWKEQSKDWRGSSFVLSNPAVGWATLTHDNGCWGLNSPLHLDGWKLLV